MNIIQKWIERRAQRKKIKELSGYASGMRTLDQLQTSGLLEWNQNARQLLIDQSLALLMMNDVDSWSNFINNVFMWQYSKECGKAWEDYFRQEELKAVRKVSEKLPNGKTLSREEVQRIRYARRKEVAFSDMEPPKVESFEFFIIAPPDLHEEHISDVAGRLVSVGHYDPETGQMEMELWESIRHLVS